MSPAKKKPSAIVPSSSKKRTLSFDDVVESDVSSDVEESAVQDTGIAKYSAQPAFDSSDLFIPKLRLAQGLTSEVQSGMAKPGDWIVLGADPLKSVTIVPMMMVRRRELRDADDNRAVLCRSSDSIHGVGNPGGECATCPMNKWVQSKKSGGKNSAPPCTFIYSYVVYIKEMDDLAVLEFYRTSIPTGKMMNTMIMQKGLGNFAVQLRSVGQSGTKGTYYSPQITAAKADEKLLKIARDKTQAVF